MQPEQAFMTTQDQGVLRAWREGVARTARDPSLKQQLLHREGELLPSFAQHYQKLKALPRRVRRFLQRRWKQSLAGFALLLALGQTPALAATINVGGGCNLLAAIRAANTDTARDGCPAGSGRDTIVLPLGSIQRLMSVNNHTLGANGLPAIRSRITISGRGSTIRRPGGAPDDFRIFAVTSEGHLTLRRTTVSGGIGPRDEFGIPIEDGGGVFNQGTLTLINSTLSRNAAYDGGGVYSESGTVIVTNSTISGNSADNGGGVYISQGTLTITNSTVSGNDAEGVGYGGGVFSESGTVTVISSTISGNTAISSGGGVLSEDGTLTLTNSTISGNYAHDYGSGVNAGGTVTITKSTISGNTGAFEGGGVSAGGTITITITNSTISGNSVSNYGGGVYNSGALTVTNSTISGNAAVGGGRERDDCPGNVCGGGIYNHGTVTLNRTLISGNTASRGREVFNGNNANITAANFNLFGRNGKAGVRGFSRGPTDIVPRKSLSAILNTDLADNGGPTQTHALVRGSPAIDRVTDGTCPPPGRDQRGVRRPQDGNGDGAAICDIGSFERRRRE